MELRDVTSSNLAQIGFDNKTNTLRVVFATGVTYDYYGVDEQTYRHLLQAPSKGKYFHRYIRDRFNYSIVE
jgi:hypothetical protein